MLTERKDLRNIAIIAHVDHGKTTWVDGLLRQAHVFRPTNRWPNGSRTPTTWNGSGASPILAKSTAIRIPDPLTGEEVKINIADTPGHADFGGEVERVLNMVDVGCCAGGCGRRPDAPTCSLCCARP